MQGPSKEPLCLSPVFHRQLDASYDQPIISRRYSDHGKTDTRCRIQKSRQRLGQGSDFREWSRDFRCTELHSGNHFSSTSLSFSECTAEILPGTRIFPQSWGHPRRRRKLLLFKGASVAPLVVAACGRR
nr:uncharacterized protein LOC118879364 [Drosophila suzukii]